MSLALLRKTFIVDDLLCFIMCILTLSKNTFAYDILCCLPLTFQYLVILFLVKLILL